MAKFEQDHSLWGRQMQVGWVKIRHFRRKTCYNLKTVQSVYWVSYNKSKMLLADLAVHLRIEYKLCLLMHSATVHLCPSYISDVVKTTAASSHQQGLHFSTSTDTFTYTVPSTFTKHGERAFSVAGPSA